ncbi:MAG: glycosyltransferase [Candidatus Heimdallarchaeota archaeon]
MKILHLADGPQNIRAERAALIAKTFGIKDHYIFGNILYDLLEKDIFKEKKYVELSRKNHYMFGLKEFNSILMDYIEEVDPDIIHAHNIFFGNIALKLDLPLLYDDHELWTKSYKCHYYKGILRKFSYLLKSYYYPRWERKLAKTKSVLVPSNGILKFYKTKYKSEKARLFPNMPLLSEVKKAKFQDRITDDLMTVTIGVSTKTLSKHRNVDGFIDLWKTNNDIGKLKIIGKSDIETSSKIISTGKITHQDCYTEASAGHVGILPYRPYPQFHKFSGANKAYLYIHSGLALITPRTQTEFNQVLEDVKYGTQFTYFDEVISYLKKNKTKLMNLDRDQIMKVAREKYVLDNFSENLEISYEEVLENYK